MVKKRIKNFGCPVLFSTTFEMLLGKNIVYWFIFIYYLVRDEKVKRQKLMLK